jgi:hypothetical protein
MFQVTSQHWIMSGKGEVVHVDDRGSKEIAAHILNLGYYLEVGGTAVVLRGKYT